MANGIPPAGGPGTASADAEQFFHYVVASLHILASSIFIVHFGLGLMMILRPGFFGGNNPPPFPLPWIGLLFTVMAGTLIGCGWTLGICTIYSGRCLARRVRRTFSIVVAALNCAVFPFGTALGVFTLVVVMRDSVRAMYDARR